MLRDENKANKFEKIETKNNTKKLLKLGKDRPSEILNTAKKLDSTLTVPRSSTFEGRNCIAKGVLDFEKPPLPKSLSGCSLKKQANITPL